MTQGFAPYIGGVNPDMFCFLTTCSVAHSIGCGVAHTSASSWSIEPKDDGLNRIRRRRMKTQKKSRNCGPILG